MSVSPCDPKALFWAQKSSLSGSADVGAMPSREIQAGERSNLIIAVGDLTLRFPNLLEPWTSHIYQPLSDPDIGAP
jgi:hypothetical protein